MGRGGAGRGLLGALSIPRYHPTRMNLETMLLREGWDGEELDAIAEGRYFGGGAALPGSVYGGAHASYQQPYGWPQTAYQAAAYATYGGAGIAARPGSASTTISAGGPYRRSVVGQVPAGSPGYARPGYARPIGTATLLLTAAGAALGGFVGARAGAMMAGILFGGFSGFVADRAQSEFAAWGSMT